MEQLYGMAIFAVPKKEDANTYTLTCTPISVSKESQERIDVVDDLKFTATFQLDNLESISKVFVQLVNMLEEITKRQNDNLKSPKPVSLYIGQDGSNPVAFDAIFTLLFNQRFHAPMTDDGIHAYVTDRLRIQHDIIARTDEQKKVVKESAYYKALIETVKNQEAEALTSVEKAEKTRENYFRNSALSEEFKIALRKLPRLLEDSKIKIGHFVRKPSEKLTDEAKKKQAAKDKREDWALLDLKQAVEANDVYSNMAHEELKRKARVSGEKFGDTINRYPDIFQLLAPSEAEKTLPGYDFYYWHPDYRDAFYKGFREICNNKEKYVKLPNDPKDPPFTNLALDMMRKIFAGKDNEAEPEPHIRQKIMASAKALSEQLEALTGKQFANDSIKSKGLRGEKDDFSPE